MSALDEIKATFFEECAELLEQLERGLLELRSGERDAGCIDAVFRAVHSIKGGAGAFHLGGLVACAHEVETVLDGLRTGQLPVTPEIIAILLRACDRLGDLVTAARLDISDDAKMPADLLALSAQLGSPPRDTAIAESGLGLDFTPVPLSFDTAPVASRVANAATGEPPPQTPPLGWTITFDPLPDLLDSGNEPLFLFRALRVLGRLRCTVQDGDMPTLRDMDPLIPRIRWSLQLEPTAEDLTETEIESVFEFADDLCVLTIQRANDTVAQDFQGTDAAELVPDRPTTQVCPGHTATPSDHDWAGTRDQLPSTPRQSRPPNLAATIRVDLGRIDRLVNLVGELVIGQSMLVQSIPRDGLDRSCATSSCLDDLQQLTRDIQESVMAIRAQPVRSLFQRMTRIVRETAQMTSKEVHLETLGEATEIDKTVVERLADPLTHMIRNAIDHGLESEAERLAAGKPAQGIVRLSARQQSDRVVIDIFDDGRGIDRGRVLSRARERGLVEPGTHLEPQDIDRLLFLPGFSTSERISPLSGRGVGLDVVQQAIRDLNGTISILSEAGKGTTISISLPLTLAILDGMIVRTAGQRMVIPLSAIIETQTISTIRIEHIGPDRAVVLLHGHFVPVIDLATGMGVSPLSGTDDDADDGALLFVRAEELGPFALRVDAIEAQRQVVIKGLGDSFGRIPCVSAATILGDGQVALIVDPGGLARAAGLTAASSIHAEVCLQ